MWCIMVAERLGLISLLPLHFCILTYGFLCALAFPYIISFNDPNSTVREAQLSPFNMRKQRGSVACPESHSQEVAGIEHRIFLCGL